MNFQNVKVPKVPGGGPAFALIKAGVIGAIGLYAATNSLYNVEGGHRAIMFNRIVGVKDKVYPEGTHLMIPWFERPIIYDSAQLIGQAIANNPAFITLRKIEASREIANTISNAANKVFLNSDDLLLNLHDLNSETVKK
uniref:Prohibitin n=1 Tax=Kalanchoe fedtschenkoi TaxID=63787 RepID=A0A7N0ZUP3_KALFE